MLESTFSPLKPTEISEDFYRQFYYQYSFIQVNSMLWQYMRFNLSASDRSKILQTLNGYHDDHQTAAFFSLSTGLMNEALMRRRKENRGICTDLYKQLEGQRIDPLVWYDHVVEFLMIYAICEQAIKDFLVSKDIESPSITEDSIIHKLFDTLEAHQLRKQFLNEFSNATANIIASQNALIASWRYFTLFRHGLIHAGGRSTDKLKDKMNDAKRKNTKAFNQICSAMYLELSSEDEDFFCNPFENDIVLLSNDHLNFFRNMAICVVESIERAIHPEEYQVPDFDPYKL